MKQNVYIDEVRFKKNKELTKNLKFFKQINKNKF